MSYTPWNKPKIVPTGSRAGGVPSGMLSPYKRGPTGTLIPRESTDFTGLLQEYADLQQMSSGGRDAEVFRIISGNKSIRDVLSRMRELELLFQSKGRDIKSSKLPAPTLKMNYSEVPDSMFRAAPEPSTPSMPKYSPMGYEQAAIRSKRGY
jgi:hypothetical protein